MKLDFCKSCRENTSCCGGERFVSRRELKSIEKEIARKLKYTRRGKLYRINSGDKCMFLGNDGCTLKNKPISCEIFPFLPLKEYWVVRTKCPHWDKLTKSHLEQVKKEFEKRKDEWVGKIR